MSRRQHGRRLSAFGAAAALVLAGAVGATSRASAAPAYPHPKSHHLGVQNAAGHGSPKILARLPKGVPAHGAYAFLLELRPASTLATYRRFAPQGRVLAASRAKSQLRTIVAAQNSAIDALPMGSRVLYRSHSVLSGVAVLTDVRNYPALSRISGVAAVYPIAPKKPANSYAVPLVGAPSVWSAHGDLGQNSTIAVIDTGIDYTHADFGGPGTVAAYTTAKALDTAAPAYPDPAKVVGGYDFAGDAYNADPTDPHFQPTPAPDANPLDCAGHGSHVAGIAAGYGVTSAGSTFAGDYASLSALSTSAYQAQFRIGPGMAPKAKLLAYKVFGCAGATDIVSAAIDRAADPNGDGDPSDHASVINMSLGGDYGSPQDGDAVESNFASQLGITVVAAAGNGGDYYDVGGSPADATRAIAVANSVDAYNQIDSLHVTFNGTAQPAMGAERSVLYDYTANPDLSGDVVQLTQIGNTDGCDPIGQTVAGKVVLVDWTDNDATRRCGSAIRADNLHAAGATGFIFADDEETFGAGINGDAAIPGVLVTKSAGDALKAALTAAALVHVTGTTTADFKQVVPGDDDKVSQSSSRGIGDAGNVKPDVSAVGTSVFSTAFGTGNQGVSETGTSMASPMVAGLAALVRSAHPDWTPEQVKADIMNTAGEDLYTASGHTGTVYAPNRVGAGRIQAVPALNNLVLAYVQDNPGAVSVSFGPFAVTGALTLTKTVKVVNTSLNPASFTIAYHPITSVPGVSFQVSPSTLSLGRAETKTFTVKLVVTNAAALTKTHDATKASSIDLGKDDQGNEVIAPTETLADASGRVQLTPANGYTGPALRVPVYSAPRPASSMATSSTLNLPSSGNLQAAHLALSGHGVNQGSGATKVKSAVAGFEVQAKSGLAPTCASATSTLCVHFGDERSADIKYLGSTSDYPQLHALGDPFAFDDAEEFIAITAQGAWRTPVGPQEFDVLIDTNGDNVPEAVIYNTRYGSEDIFLSEIVDLTDPACATPAGCPILDDALINDRLGTTDTALFDSDTMVLPIFVGDLEGLTAHPVSASHPRIRYGVVSFGETGPVDAVGANASTGNLLSSALSVDLARPGVEMYGSTVTGTLGQVDASSLLLYPDLPGTSVTVRRDIAAYNADRGQGAMLVHFHNAIGGKSRLVTLKTLPKVSLKLSTTKIAHGKTVTATVTVANTAAAYPTGTVLIHQYSPSKTLGSHTLSSGRATISFSFAKAGTYKVRAQYGGDTRYASGVSAYYTITVT